MFYWLMGTDYGSYRSTKQVPQGVEVPDIDPASTPSHLPHLPFCQLTLQVPCEEKLVRIDIGV